MSDQHANSEQSGYYNHCSICGLIAGEHYPQKGGEGSGYTAEIHPFVPSNNELFMGSPAPTWQDYWALLKRVAILERKAGVR